MSQYVFAKFMIFPDEGTSYYFNKLLIRKKGTAISQIASYHKMQHKTL